MDLGRVRIQLTVVYGVLSALAVGAIAWIAISAGTDRIYDSAERDVEQEVRQLALEPGEYTPVNTFVVHIDEENRWTDTVGDAWVELPLYTIADLTGGGSTFGRYNYLGETWLAYSVSTSESEWLVSAIELSEYDDDASSLRWRIRLAAVALIIGTTAAGWWIAGRSLKPARTAMAQQRDFIADAAHELRTPLAVIQASASHALAKHRDGDEYRQSLNEIRAATERAGGSVGELLEMARLDAGSAEPRLAPLRLDLLIEEVAAGIRVEGVDIVAEPGDPLVANADYHLLRQVVDSLTRNAASRSSRVELTTGTWEGWAIVNIVDNGPGFAPDLLPVVFDRFRRGDTKGSSGLGMAIAKSIVEQHGGRVDASNNPTEGAQVRLVLPLAKQ